MDIKVGFKLLGSTYVPAFVNLEKNPHFCIIGESGSGKSVTTQVLFNSLLNYREDLDIYIADFKSSGDYAGLSPHFAEGIDCFSLVDEFFAKFEEIKATHSGKKQLLCFDEYAAAAIYAKQDKELYKHFQNEMAQLLMQGRSLPGNEINGNGGAWVWHILQRPDADYYPAGARDQFFVYLCMGAMSKSTRLMLDISEDELPEPINGIGQGYIVQSGKPISKIQIPQVNITQLHELLKYKARGLDGER